MNIERKSSTTTTRWSTAAADLKNVGEREDTGVLWILKQFSSETSTGTTRFYVNDSSLVLKIVFGLCYGRGSISSWITP